eukprot:scaffold163253_cov31-Tisochrysis_lutea.AAC.5
MMLSRTCLDACCSRELSRYPKDNIAAYWLARKVRSSRFALVSRWTGAATSKSSAAFKPSEPSGTKGDSAACMPERGGDTESCVGIVPTASRRIARTADAAADRRASVPCTTVRKNGRSRCAASRINSSLLRAPSRMTRVS